MNILILNWKDIKNPHVGGAEIIAFEFARRLAKDGHKVIFFSRSFARALPKEIIDGVTIIRKGNLVTVYLYAFFFYQSLRKKPDIVIDMINTIGWQTPLYIPSEKRVAYLNQLAREVWFYEFMYPLAVLGYLFERIQYFFYRSTKFLCYSQSTKDDLVFYGIPEKNISVFPLGLDHKRYKPQGNKSKDPLFLFVARLVKMKRADVCIHAMKKIHRKYPKAKLLIIGNGPDENRLLQLRSQLKLEKNVLFVNKDNFFVDFSKKDQKVFWMQKAWSLLLPSVKEGWGMVVTEAAACATPAIVTDVSGLRDSVIHNKTGIILPKKNITSNLAKAMEEVIESKKLRNSLSQNATTWARNFSWDKSYKSFQNNISN